MIQENNNYQGQSNTGIAQGYGYNAHPCVCPTCGHCPTCGQTRYPWGIPNTGIISGTIPVAESSNPLHQGR